MNTTGCQEFASACAERGAVVGRDDRPVDMPGLEVADHPRSTVAGLGHRQHHLHVGVAEGLECAVVDLREVGIGEHALVGLRHDHGDHAGPPGHQRAGSAVGVVVELGDGLAHGLGGLCGHQRPAVHHSRDRGPGDARDAGNVLERRRRVSPGRT